MTLKSLRLKIDEIDDKLLKLLNERASCAVDVGRIKITKNLPIYSPEREKQIIERLISKNPGPLQEHSIRTLFERIIDESRHLERITAERER